MQTNDLTKINPELFDDIMLDLVNATTYSTLQTEYFKIICHKANLNFKSYAEMVDALETENKRRNSRHFSILLLTRFDDESDFFAREVFNEKFDNCEKFLNFIGHHLFYRKFPDVSFEDVYRNSRNTQIGAEAFHYQYGNNIIHITKIA